MQRISKITIDSLTKKFYENGDEKLVIDNIYFEFSIGKLYVIKGKSGCGKSTLASLIGLLDAPTGGRVLFDQLVKEDRERFRAENISFLFQDNNLFDCLTGRENLELVTDDSNKIDEIAKRLNIVDLLGKKVERVSKGEGARLAICRIILEDKPIMIFDEPTGNLDGFNSQVVFSLLSELSANHIVIVIAHDYNEAEGGAELIYLRDGKIVTGYSGEAIIDDKLPNPFSRRTISCVNAAKFSHSFFSHHIVDSLLAFIMTLALSFAFCSSVSLSLFSGRQTVVGILENYGLASVDITSNSPIKNSYRSFFEDVELVDGSTINVEVAYGKKSYSTFYSPVDIADDEILIPRYKAERYGISDGDVLGIKNQSITAHLIQFDYDNTLARLTAKLKDEKAAMSVINESAPCLVSLGFARSLVSSEEIPVSRESLYQVRTILNNNSISTDPAKYFITTSETATGNGIMLASSFKDEQTNEDTILEMFNDRTVRILPAAMPTASFDLNLLVDDIRIDYIEFSDNPSDISTTLVLGKSLSESLIDGCFELGVFSTKGSTSYRLPKSEFKKSLPIDSNDGFYGLISKGDIQAFSAYDTYKVVIIICAAIFSILLLVAFYFYQFSLKRGYKDTDNLLAAIGFNKRAGFRIKAFSSLIPVILPTLLGSLVLYPSTADLLSAKISKMLGCTMTYSYSRLDAFVFLSSLLFVAIYCLMLIAEVLKSKDDLLNAIKISKE